MRKNKVEYAVVCATGKVRRNNEDNFCCCGHIRENVNSVEDVVFSGVADANANELFAVFDGMGGEACGEVASYVAANQSLLFTRSNLHTGVHRFAHGCAGCACGDSVHLISRVSSRISASQFSSTNRDISSIRLSAIALCGTMAAMPITMI